MVYDFTRFDNLETGRANRPSRLRSDSGFRTQRSDRLAIRVNDRTVFVLPQFKQIVSGDGDTLGDIEARDISMVVRVTEKSGQLCDTLRDKLHGLSAMRAVNYLNYSFDAGCEEIEINGVKSSPTILMDTLPALQTALACEVAPLSFWGGPPGKRTWYEGSLLTLLVDHIMRAAEAGNIGLLSRFLNLTI